jgi:peptidoglycan biosynthesis protein MviN/MurJ (putative lipid II flippase)
MGAPVSLGLALLALGWRATGWPARPGWDDGWLFLLWLSTVPVLNALASVLAGYLNAEEWYLTVAGSATLRGVVALAIGFGSAQFGLASYASGLAAGELAALGALAASEAGRRVFAVPPSGDNLGPFWSLFLSMAFGGLANSSKGFVDRFVATTLGVGAVSILEFVERIFLMAVSFLGAPFATVVLSRWSAAHPSGGRSSATALLSGVNYSQRLAALLGSAIFAGGSLLAVSPIATWLFQRFSAAEAHTARIALICYLAGAVPYLAGLVTTQAIFVVRDAAFVARIAIAVALLNVPLDLIGMWAFGLPGIALATSALHVIGWVAASRRLKRHASPALEPGAAR